MTKKVIFKMIDGGIVNIESIDKVFYANENKSENLDREYTLIELTKKDIIVIVPLEEATKIIARNALAINKMSEETFMEWTKTW